ncbi:MAG: hypothetical protein R2702_00640 [Acidimicrobiales bacterium]
MLDGLVAVVADRPPLDPSVLARLAHEVETVRAGREAGVQDQWAAALGGAGLLAIGPYPEVRHRSIEVPARASVELGERLVTVVFGPHDSSAVHRQVIDALVTCSGVEHHHAREALKALSRLAGDAADALGDGDLDCWGEVLRRSVEAQAALHPDLVGAPHRRAIEVARSSVPSGGRSTAPAAAADRSRSSPGGARRPARWRTRSVPPIPPGRSSASVRRPASPSPLV